MSLPVRAGTALRPSGHSTAKTAAAVIAAKIIQRVIVSVSSLGSALPAFYPSAETIAATTIQVRRRLPCAASLHHGPNAAAMGTAARQLRTTERELGADRFALGGSSLCCLCGNIGGLDQESRIVVAEQRAAQTDR